MSKRKSPARRRPADAVVGRFFQGLPVIDAAEPLRVVVNRADVAGARKLDPNNCAFAKACRRLFDAHTVLVLRRTAYVELPDRNGRRIVNRFVISNATADKIITFDQTGEFPEGGFIFSAPPPSKTMDAHVKYAREYARREKNGHKATVKRAKPRRSKVTLSLVRDGRGKLGINYAF